MPDLRTIRGIELVKPGVWMTSTGEWTVTADDLASAVAAHKANAAGRKPVIKLGHTGMGDAGPALGYVDNLRIDAAGTLVGDLIGVPAAVAKLLPHAYPDRSVEALLDHNGHKLVLTGLALLGATPPAVDTLRSLQDVAQLYGVELAAASGRRIIVAASAFHSNHDPARARAVQVAAARRRRTNRLIGA